MKLERDMDFVRELLLEIEGGKTAFEPIANEEAAMLGFEPDVPISREDAGRLRYHLELLANAKFVDLRQAGGASFQILRITWAGHDFLDSVRDAETWAKTKKGALAAGGFTVDLLKDLAKGLIKKQIEERTGVSL